MSTTNPSLPPSLPPSLLELSTLLLPSELVPPSSPLYASESLTWSSSANLSPKLIARPLTLTSLSTLLSHLSTISPPLNITSRSQGIGSASASDLLISLSAFNFFTYHPSTSTLPARITVGTGQPWGAVDSALHLASPGAACLSARCSFVGVGGSVLCGGLSWLSSEHGLASDPANLLDATIVLADGRIVHSAKDEEPDLLWAVRGGGGSFGVVTSVTLRVFPDYAPGGIFTGRVFYPRSSLEEVVRKVVAYSERCTDPKMALHFYCLTMETKQAEEVMGLEMKKASMGVAIMMYDAHGEAHGKSEEGFKWAMDIEGATAMTSTLPLKDVNTLADDLGKVKGQANAYFSAITVPKLTDKMLLSAWDWMDKLLAKDPAIAEVPLGTVVLIEVMQKAAFQSLKSPADAAWPRTRNRHVLQLGAAAPQDRPELEGVVVKALEDAASEIVGEGHKAGDFLPNFLNGFNDVRAIFGGNWERLVEVKRRYDPKNTFGGRFAEGAK
jgi:hypothetical protein